jgi:hypothetical protein
VSPRCPHALGFDTLRLEGALLLPDLLEKAAQGQASCQQPDDYHVPRGFTLQEEIGRAFRIALAQWQAFSAGFERTDLDAHASARAFVEEFLRDALGYAGTRPTPPRSVGERSFPVTLEAAPNIPVVVAPAAHDLDDPDPAFAPSGGGARKKSPFQLLQEYLNAEPEARWGFASNGRRLRLARDAATLTRPSFIELDLEAMLGQARYYILDPASVMGADYPSETFRVLKQNEEREFGEYRTQRLVLATWDRLHAAEPTRSLPGVVA